MAQGQKPIITLPGQDGSIFLYEDKVIIDRRGLSFLVRMALEPNVDAYITLFYTQIVGVNLRYATNDLISQGTFRILLPNSKPTANQNDLRADGYNIYFKKKENETAQKVKAEIEKRVAISGQSTELSVQVQTGRSRHVKKVQTII